MEPSGKKGIFVGYNETSKSYRIYVPGQRQIEVSRDVTFDEDATFLRSESHLDVETEEHEAPKDAKDPVPDSPHSDVQREEHPDHVQDSVDPVELVGPLERLYLHLLLRGGQLGYKRLCRKKRNILL